MAGEVAIESANQGLPVAWVVPTYRNARPVWRFAEKLLRSVANRVTINRSEMTIKFPSGGWLGVYTADNPVSILGEAFGGVICEEAARFAPSVWEETLLPTLADLDGWAMLISTPRGRNWFHNEFQRGLNDGKIQASFTATSSANPIPSIQKAFELARQRISERTFRQEWLAEFIEDGGGVFRFIRESATAAKQEAPIENHTYVAGLDWALSVDFTVLTIIDVTTKQEAYKDRFNGVDYSLQRQRIAATCQRFGVRIVIAEENAMGKPNNDELRKLGIPIRDFTTTNSTKAEIIESLAAGFEQRRLSILNDPMTISQLESYQSERLKSGMTRYSAPDNMHDDDVMSLALAWSAAGQPYGSGLVSFG